MDGFLTACGVVGPLTLEITGPGAPAPERRSFPQPFVLIGRDDRADLVLDDEAVSRRHAYLQIIDGRAFFIDLDSRTGTAAGPEPSESGWLDTTRPTLQVGPYTIRVVPPEDGGIGGSPDPDDEPPPSPLLSRSAARSDLPEIALEFQSRSAGHSVWRMSPMLAMLGSSPRCKVRLLDSGLSRLHCALLRTKDGLWVVDLLGRDGLLVNGQPLRSARLEHGDALGLGQVTVRVSVGDDSTGHRAILPSSRSPVPWGARPPAAMPYADPPAPPGRYAPDPRSIAPAGPAAADPSLALLLNHFGQMQQQMLDQFQQSMMMMLQMFGGMHREQMGLVREEMERLRELGTEMAAIKAELARRPPSGGYGRATNGRAAVSGPVARPGPAPPPTPPPPAPPQAAPTPPTPGAPPTPGPAATHRNGDSPSAPAPGPAEAAADATNAPPRRPVIPPLESQADVHLWLTERLNAITDEQQTRWHRVMSLIRGGK